MNDVTMFDRPYSPEKQAEGMAIHWAVVFGVCNNCQHIKQCETDDMFTMPLDAACMVRKGEILREMEAHHE